MKKGFTLVEVLIALSIIGIIITFTITTLVPKYQERATVVKLRKFYNDFSQAYALAVFENGTIDTWGLKASQQVVDKNGNLVHSEQSIEQYEKFFGVIEKYFNNIEDKNFRGAFKAGNKEATGYVLPNGIRIYAMWLQNPAACNVKNNLKYYCGDFYVVVDGKNIKDSNNRFRPNVFAFNIHPEQISPFGAESGTFARDCLTGANYSRCTGWVITYDNMDYLHCKNLIWGHKTKCN